MPRVLLICCEGKTEKEYFEILRRRVLRLPGYIDVRIEGEKGQHAALVDRTVELRSELAKMEELKPEDVECWAVCDEDKMTMSFAELKKYAEDREVRLAFSRPQFESYLLQHFEQSKDTNRKEIIRKLESCMRQYGAEKYDKADLEWLEHALVDKPKLVEIAVTNSDQRTTQSATPFLTVQNLTKRMMSLTRR